MALTSKELGALARKEQSGDPKKKAKKTSKKKTSKKKVSKKKASKRTVRKSSAPSHNPDGLSELRHSTDVVRKATKMVEDCGIKTNPASRPLANNGMGVSNNPNPLRKTTTKKRSTKKRVAKKTATKKSVTKKKSSKKKSSKKKSSKKAGRRKR